MQEERLRANIAALTNRYVSASQLKASTVLARAANDARFLERTSAGKTFTIRVYDKALQWFSDHWPEGAEWPASVARPRPTSAEAAS